MHEVFQHRGLPDDIISDHGLLHEFHLKNLETLAWAPPN